MVAVTPRAQGQFWPPVIKDVKKVNSGFQFVAECYWDREYELHTFGFDFCYDKTLYDRLKELDVYKVKAHLQADLGYQAKLCRFLENHDEERAADSWKDTRQNMAAAVISFTIPGMHFIHDGQQEGRVRRISMHVNCRSKLNDDVKDKHLAGKYSALIKALGSEAVRNGEWRPCATTPSMDGNPSHERFVAHVNWKGEKAVVLTVVNFAGEGSNGHVLLPEKHFGWLRGKKVKLIDMLSDTVIEKDGGVLLGVCVYVCVCVSMHSVRVCVYVCIHTYTYTYTHCSDTVIDKVGGVLLGVFQCGCYSCVRV